MEEVPTEKHDNNNPTVSFTSKIKRWTFFIVFQIALVLLVLEITVRFIDPLGISYYPETARMLDSLMIKEEPIGYRCQPNISDTFYGVSVKTNSYGLRDREFTSEAAQDEFRILVMGDSVMFGIEVTYEESIPHQLELIANGKSSQNRRYRTINMGVPSYNTKQEKIQLETLGMSFKPDLVILVFSSNDIESKMWVFDKRASWIANISQRSYAICTLFVLKNKIVKMLKSKTPVDKETRYQSENPRWLSLKKSMIEMNQLCKNEEVPFVLFLPQASDHPAVSLLSKVGKEEGFEVLRLRPFDNPRWKNEDRTAYRNSVVDSHPNSKGCKIQAEMIYELLSQENLLD